MNCPECAQELKQVDFVDGEHVVVKYYLCEYCEEHYSAEYRFDELQKWG